MSEKPTIPNPQYTWAEGLGAALALGQRCMAEISRLARTPGPTGARGPAGEKGEPGRNSSDLAFLFERIDERIGQRFEIATVTTPDGGRTMQWSMAGKVHEVKTAVVLDAGVWKEGAAYVAGDAVSHGGSLFIAQTETSAKPGKSDDWRLAVKRGSDGRDYRAEEKRNGEPVRFK